MIYAITVLLIESDYAIIEEIVDYIDADLFVYNNKTIDENKD